MIFKYLEHKNWVDITRDERFFCAHLYFEIFRNNLPFLQLLSDKKIINTDELISTNWEVSYEVCFYRDFIHEIGFNGIKEIGNTDYSKLSKRTFDLCLFSENKIIIIEAKAQQGFDTEQMESFIEDKILVQKLVGANVEIKLLGLASSKYHPKESTKRNFDALIDWNDINIIYFNQLFLKANDIYGK